METIPESQPDVEDTAQCRVHSKLHTKKYRYKKGHRVRARSVINLANFVLGIKKMFILFESLIHNYLFLKHYTQCFSVHVFHGKEGH